MRWIGIALAACIGLAQSQTEKTSTPKFEVTSVKPNKSPDLCKGLIQYLPGGRYVATNVPLIRVIASAWNLPLQSQRLILASGVRMPDEFYDIEATSEKGMFPPEKAWEGRYHTMQSMVKALLEDRFKLRIRREPKEQPVYALVVGKGGPRLEKSKFQEPYCDEEIGPKLITNPACHWLDGGQDGGLHGASVSIAEVVEGVGENWTDRPLFDKTGLTGFYNIQTEGWVPMKPASPQSCEASAGSSDDRPTLFEVFEKLGLRMESQRAVVDMFVIDHVEKPGEN